MAKVTRKKMGRGVELTVDQVFDPIKEMRDEIGNIEAEQMQARYATFRLNFNIPWLGSKYFYDNRTIGTTAEMTSAGTGYTDPAGEYYAVSTTGGAGSGLLVDIVIGAGGTITQVSINDPGTGYQDGDEVEIEQPNGVALATMAKLRLTVGEDAYDGPFYIPFCLPPLQEDIESSVPIAAREGAPFPILDEVSFSLDQSDEPAMILGQWYGRDKYQYTPARRWMPNPYAGKKTYERTDAYDFTLSIYEKEQFYFHGGVKDADALGVGGEAVSLSYPSSAFIGRTTRFNPIAVGEINRQFDPFKTYCLAIFAPNLHDKTLANARGHCVANNVWVSLKFKMPLTSRDEATAGAQYLVQNVPLHYGQRTAPSVTIDEPTGAGPHAVIADGTSKGISSNLQLIDQQFSDKLRGGYGEFAQKYPNQNIKDDAAYEVMAVPMGAGFTHNRMSARDDYVLAPYVSGASFTQAGTGFNPEHAYVDRRIIPIDGDMTIHHVIVALNWSSDKIQNAYDPATTGAITYRSVSVPGALAARSQAVYKVGVGMLAGPRADDFEYQQIAYSEFTPSSTMLAGPANGIIDFIKMGLPSANTLNADESPAEWALISVPVRNQAALAAPKPVQNGSGYWGFETTPTWLAGQQGRPYFVGEGNTYTHDRTSVGTAAGGAAQSNPLIDSEGCEQFLEVRLSVDPSDSVYTSHSSPPTWEANYGEGDIFLGYGGCWVYIIGKKHLK